MSTRRSTSGLSLLEVMLALGLLSVVTLALMAVFTSGNRMMAQSTSLTMATDVCREFLERTRCEGYNRTLVGVYDGRVGDPSDITTGFPHAPYPASTRNGKDYHLFVEVTQVGPETRLIKLRVYWEDGRHHTGMATMVHL